ncbi:MAG: hypothetical protein GY720_15960 [bacterium]|nr:hypothetical protein [bacterium]
MPSQAVLNKRADMQTWFKTVFLSAAFKTWARGRLDRRGPTPHGRFPHRTPYLEDAGGSGENTVPDEMVDWRRDWGAEFSDPDPVLWTTEPTQDAEGNQITEGVPAHGWLTAPVSHDGVVIEPGVPDPNPVVTKHTWRGVWKGGLNADTTTFPIKESTPKPANGRFLCSLTWNTQDRRRARTGPQFFRNIIVCRVRYTDENDRTQEIHDEIKWVDETLDDGVTWNDTVDADWVETYNGPTEVSGTP